ncbi:glycosyltransferase [Neomicrococcus lactis]|uniref:Glycosyltransferase involved in cell wall biosynthesis n=1 Tax=Neomicrococcus lactis TaxID=732241 RepID=A0A7W8Y9Y3_9MICC|nr:glycosyltransferase [Neomicrococcus lactis]MBB5597522.1 glycosyltransferase involved in cell wall biosynthesis [Neomicrococcus lactis]
MPRVVLYGDVNLNVLDGSAIWLLSMAEALSLGGCEVTIPLKSIVKTDRLSAKLASMPNVKVIPAKPTRGRDSIIRSEVRAIIENLIRKNRPDLVIARGIDVCDKLVESDPISEILWSYVTEYHYPIWDMDDQQVDKIQRVCSRSQRVFAQTEEARAHLEATIPEAAGKTLILTPMVPDEFFADLSAVSTQVSTQESPRVTGDPLRLIYSGKFAKEWLTLEAPELVQALAEQGVKANLRMVGDKFQKSPVDPEWPLRMKALANTPPDGVTFEGGVSREKSRELISHADVGLSWRSAALDQSVEISTKVLEYSASGVPPLLNRTAAHEKIFGADYPLFLGPNERSVDGAAKVLAEAVNELPQLRLRAQAAVEPYRLSNRAKVIRGYIDRFLGSYLSAHGVAQTGPKKHKVLVAGHDLKFAGELLDMLKGRPDVELRIDHWETLHKNNEAESQKLLDWADTIFCEWAGPNSVWYSQRKKSHQRLVVRLHMFELGGPWLGNINFDAIDQLVTVSELYRDITAEQTKWDKSKIVVIANGIDVLDLDRPKIEGSEFRIGLVGIVPWRKRPDRAVEVLRQLLDKDPRFTLHIKGRMPWDYAHEWKKEDQRKDYETFFKGLGTDPRIGERVVFEPFGADMGNWLSKMGFILSPSTSESFHLAPAEGMASGAVPILWERDGVRGIFGDHFVVADNDAAAARILALVADPALYASESKLAKESAKNFDIESVNVKWQEALFPTR